MSIEVMKQALDALTTCRIRSVSEWSVEDVTPKNITSAIETLRTAIQQAEPKHRHWSEALADDLTESGDIQTNTHPAPGVPDGWSIEEKCGDLIVRKNGFGGYSARKNTESIAEAVLHELALDLLAASPAQKGGE